MMRKMIVPETQPAAGLGAGVASGGVLFLVIRLPGALEIVPFIDGGDHRVDACRQAAVDVTRLEAWGDLVGGDVLAGRIGQRAFETAPGLNPELVVLEKHEENRPVVLVLLPDLPRAENAQAVVIDGGIRLHLRVDDDENLIGSLLLQLDQLLIEMVGGRRV